MFVSGIGTCGYPKYYHSFLALGPGDPNIDIRGIKAGLHEHIHIKFASHFSCDHRM